MAERYRKKHVTRDELAEALREAMSDLNLISSAIRITKCQMRSCAARRQNEISAILSRLDAEREGDGQ